MWLVPNVHIQLRRSQSADQTTRLITRNSVQTNWNWIDIQLELWLHDLTKQFGLVWFMVFYATSNNISVILWQSVLLVEETGVPRENHWPASSHWQTLSHNIVIDQRVKIKFS